MPPNEKAWRALAAALASYLRELFASEQRNEDLVEVAVCVPVSRRTVFRARRGGKIEGAARVGRKWFASRGAVNAWLVAEGRLRVVPDEDEFEELRRMLSRPKSPSETAIEMTNVPSSRPSASKRGGRSRRARP
jgi:hypothetical protein